MNMHFNSSTMLLVILALVLSQSLQTNATESSIVLSAGDVLALSRVHHETRSIGLDLRCEVYEQKLRELLPEIGKADVSASEILHRSIEAESLKRLPFQNKSPVLSDLQECVEKVPKYRSYDRSESSPEQPSNSLAGLGASQKEDVTIRDTESPSKANIELCNKEAFKSVNQHSAIELIAILEACLQRQSSQLEVLRQQLAKREPCEDKSIDLEQALSRKNDEIDELKAKLKDLENVFEEAHIEGAAKRVNFKNMRDLYDQVYERELRTNKKLEEAQKRIAQLEALLGRQVIE